MILIFQLRLVLLLSRHFPYETQNGLDFGSGNLTEAHSVVVEIYSITIAIEIASG